MHAVPEFSLVGADDGNPGDVFYYTLAHQPEQWDTTPTWLGN
jgi:hypothetical protein